MAKQYYKPQKRRNQGVYDADDTNSTRPSFYRPESSGDTSSIDDALSENERVMSSLPLSGSDINDLESNPSDSGQASEADQEESDGIPFKKEDGSAENEGSRLSRWRAKARNLNRRTKAAIGGGIITGGVGITAFFGLGSFQAIHLSKILSLDQAGNEQSSDVRMNGLFRYVRSGGNLGETRVSHLGSKKFAATKAQLADIGVEFNENRAFGVQKGLLIDTTKFPATKGLSRDQARARLASFYKEHGITQADIKNVSGNRLYVDNRSLGISSTRGLVNSTVGALDKGKISTWTRARVIKNYFNLPSAFHPFKRADAKITQSIAARYEAKQREKARLEGREYKSQTLDDARSNLKSKLTGAKAAAAGALLVTAGVCLARDAADDAITFNREGIVVPQALEAVDKIAIGAQQQSGMDFAPEQLDAANKLMTDDDGKTIWDARALKAKTDPNASDGEDLPWDYGQAFSGGGTASTLKDLGGTAGAWACSPVGQVGQAIGGILLIGFAPFTGGSTAAAYSALKIGTQAAIGAAVMIGLQNLLTNALKDDAIPEDISAPLKGNLLAYGSRELANINARAAGGVELSAQESAKIDNTAASESQSEFQSKSFFAKMFDPKDYRSVAGKLINEAGSPQQGLKNMATSFMNIGPALVSTLRSLNPSVQAAEPYNYGFNRYGIPQRILNNEAYDDPYDNAERVAALLSSDQGNSYIDRAEKCFGVTIEKEDGLWAVTPERDVNPNSSEYEEANCKDAGDSNWDRVMLFVKDSSEMEAAACYLGEDDSCKKLGVTQEENVCSVESGPGGTARVAGMPDWVKMPVVNAPIGGPVSGNIDAASVNARSYDTFPEVMRTIASNNPDFIGLNEIADESIERMEASTPGYGAWKNTRKDTTRGNPAQSVNNAIMWKKDKWTLVDSGSVKITEDDQVNFNGKKIWDRFAVWGVFKRKTDGAIVSFIATHMMTNPTRSSQWGDQPFTRIEQYELGVDILIQLAATLSPHGPVIIGGDMNNGAARDAAWSAVPKLEGVGYKYTSAGVDSIFYPKGTKLLSSKSPYVNLHGDHGNQYIHAKIDMNNTGPGAIEGVPTTSTSTDSEECDNSAGSVPYTNPVYNGSAPDPSVIRADDGKYHVYATGRVHLVSEDMVNWEKRDDKWNVRGLPNFACYWAPDVAKVGSKYVLTFSAHANGCFPPNNPDIYYAVGDNAGGPFTYKGGLGLANGMFSIDSHIFTDDDGKSWLFFGGGVLRLVQVKLEGENLKKVGGIQHNLFDRVNPSDPTVEGWWVTKKDGYYYLYYSYGGYQTKSGPNEYSVRIARSRNVNGPYAPRDEYRPLLLGKDPIHAPGHNSTTTDDAGNEWMVYHGYYKNGSERVLMIDPIKWEGGWPVVDGPSSERRQGPSINGVGGGGTGGSGSVSMKDDYKSPQCENFRAGGAPGLACDEQCVDFVKFRLKKHIDRNKFASLGNGKDVANGLRSGGYTVNQTPAVNAVASWPAGFGGANSTYGHTAMVSAVHADGSITVEEYNWSPGRYSVRKIPASVAKGLTYAHTEKDF